MGKRDRQTDTDRGTETVKYPLDGAAQHSILLSPFLIGRMFLREPSWKYSAKLAGS